MIVEPSSAINGVWLDVLRRTEARDVVTPHKIVTASVNDYVSTLLKSLSEAQVTGAVITHSEKPGVLGFVDVMDLMTFVADSVSGDITKESIQDLKWEGQCIAWTVSGDLINYSQTDPYCAVSPKTSLLECVKLLAKGHHRLAVVESGKIITILSQSDILEFLSGRGVLLGSKLDLPIGNAGLGPLGVTSVRDNISVIDVLRYMKTQKVSGVAVVDSEGKIVGNFSGSDLLGINEENFFLLSLPINEFLFKIHGFPKLPVCCKITDTVEVVILRMLVQKVHRIYIVEDMKPTGIITLTDLMQFLLAPLPPQST